VVSRHCTQVRNILRISSDPRPHHAFSTTDSIIIPNSHNIPTIIMQYLYLTLAAAICGVHAQTTSSASAGASPIGDVIPVGGNCDPNGTPCALGANCYATNSMLQTVCGNFQATCTNDQQCAFNKCNEGFCNGALLSSASSSASPATSSSACPAPGSTDSQGRYSCNPAHQYPSGQECRLVDGCYFLSSTLSSSASSAPTSTPTAPAGSLALGEVCDPFQKPSPCAGGAECWASNSGLIPRCGNFNAACTTDANCAYNTCNNGLCNGFKPTGSYNASSSAPAPTGGYSTGSPTNSSTPPFYTGAASSVGFEKVTGVMAAVMAAMAFAL
jgi:hypothetical protein